MRINEVVSNKNSTERIGRKKRKTSKKKRDTVIRKGKGTKTKP